MTATAVPTSIDEANIKNSLVSELGVEASAIEGFIVISVLNSRRRRRTLLATYTWTTTFTVTVSLSDTGYSSAAAFATAVVSTLQSAAFQTDLANSGVLATVDTSSVVAVLNTRSPVPAPSTSAINAAGDAPTTTATSTATTASKEASATSSSSSEFSPIAAAAISVAVLAIILCLCWYAFRATTGSKLGDDFDPLYDQEQAGKAAQTLEMKNAPLSHLKLLSSSKGPSTLSKDHQAQNIDVEAPPLCNALDPGVPSFLESVGLAKKMNAFKEKATDAELTIDDLCDSALMDDAFLVDMGCSALMIRRFRNQQKLTRGSLKILRNKGIQCASAQTKSGLFSATSMDSAIGTSLDVQPFSPGASMDTTVSPGTSIDQ